MRFGCGELVLSATAPDVVLYPILKRFRWVKTNLALVPTGEFYYHDGSSWVIEKPAGEYHRRHAGRRYGRN